MSRRCGWDRIYHRGHEVALGLVRISIQLQKPVKSNRLTSVHAVSYIGQNIIAIVLESGVQLVKFLNRDIPFLSHGSACVGIDLGICDLAHTAINTARSGDSFESPGRRLAVIL
jgi:hypothetical protein